MIIAAHKKPYPKPLPHSCAMVGFLQNYFTSKDSAWKTPLRQKFRLPVVVMLYFFPATFSFCQKNDQCVRG
jgi:hypothetical protein